MTVLTLRALADEWGAPALVDATATVVVEQGWGPASRVVGQDVIFWNRLSSQITDGVATPPLELPVLPFGYHFHLEVKGPAGQYDRYFAPPTGDTIDVGDTVEVNPGTSQPDPAADAWIEFRTAVDAVGVQVHSDAAVASTAATDAANAATAAGTSAVNAGQSAATASGHVTAAVTARDESRVARDASAVSATASGTARDQAVAAKNDTITALTPLTDRVVTLESKPAPTVDTLSGATTTGKNLMKATDAAAALSTLGAVSATKNAIKLNAAALLGSIGALRNPIPPVSTDIPTVSYQTATSVTSPQIISPQSALVNKLGHPGTWNPTFSRLTVTNVHGLGFDLVGTTVEVHLFVGGANTPVWIWVDGKPISAAPVSMGNSASAETYVKLVFPTAARRTIEFYTQSNNAWRTIRTTATGIVTPSQTKPAVAFVGDSFFAGDTATFTPPQLTAAAIMGRALGVDFHIRGVGGTGYSTANGFGSAARIASVASIPNLRAIVISGTVNDDLAATVGAEAASTYAGYNASNPGVPVVVFGPQPSSATETISANRAARNAAVKAAALAAPNVVAYVDMIGTAGGYVEAYSASVTYSDGQRVTRNGSVYEFSNGGTPASNQDPATSTRWKLVTWLYTGTGNAGSPTGNGTRDVVLYLDNVHPTTDGSFALGNQQASAVIEALIAYLRTA